jgi:hypothetical protein
MAGCVVGKHAAGGHGMVGEGHTLCVTLCKESERHTMADDQRDARDVVAVPIEQASVPFFERDPITTTTRRRANGAAARATVCAVGQMSSRGERNRRLRRGGVCPLVRWPHRGWGRAG